MDNATHIVTSFEVIDHGIEHSQYFQGCGTSWTSYNHVATGIGSNFAEAYEDATEQMAQGAETINFNGFDARVLKDIGRRALPKRPQVTSKHSDEHYYRVSIRYNLALDTSPTYSVTVGNVGTVYDGKDKLSAREKFESYANISKLGHGRAGGEEVTMWENGEPIDTYCPPAPTDTNEQTAEPFDGAAGDGSTLR